MHRKTMGRSWLREDIGRRIKYENAGRYHMNNPEEVGHRNKILTHEAIQVSQRASKDRSLNGNWCFIAGFVFIWLGSKRRTDDMDILTREIHARDQIVEILLEQGFELIKQEPHQWYLTNPKLGVSAHLVLNRVFEKQMPDVFWSSIRIQGEEEFPLPDFRDLLILKALSFSRRPEDDPKKGTDLQDARFLWILENFSEENIVQRASQLRLRHEAKLLLRELGHK